MDRCKKNPEKNINVTPKTHQTEISAHTDWFNIAEETVHPIPCFKGIRGRFGVITK